MITKLDSNCDGKMKDVEDLSVEIVSEKGKLELICDDAGVTKDTVIRKILSRASTEPQLQFRNFEWIVKATAKLRPKSSETELDPRYRGEQWNEYKKAIQMFPYFNGWSVEVIKEGYHMSKIRTYEPDNTILGAGKCERNFGFFLLKGQCQMIQELKISRPRPTSNSSRQIHYQLLSHKDEPKPNELAEIYFFQVCLMNKGECFGIGEDFKHRSIIALTDVKCLLCPLHWLIQHSQANIWERIKQFLNRRLPNSEQLFKAFVEQQEWLQYREMIVKNVPYNKTNNTTSHDVPYSIRITERKETH